MYVSAMGRFSGKAAACGVLLLASACATTGTTPEASTAKPAKAAKPAAPVYTLDELLGAEPVAVDALLGAPALTRREGDGEYRRYPLKECALIVILYPDDQGLVRAAHVDTAALQSGEEKPDLDACLAAG
jgi:hypothetical protein